MSWITEILSSTDNGGPFIKFITRIFLLVILIVILYAAFSLITGKKIIFNNGTYEIVDSKTADSIANYTKPLHKNTLTDSYNKIKGVTLHKKKPKKIIKHSQQAPLRLVSDSATATLADPGHLNEDDKRKISSIMDQYINNESHDKFPVWITYNPNITSSYKCAFELKDYFKEIGFPVKNLLASDISDKGISFWFSNYYNDFRVFVGSVDSNPKILITHP